MKRVLLGIMLITLSFGANAKEVAKVDDTKRIKTLAQGICVMYNLSGSNIAKDVKEMIVKYMAKYEGNKNPTGAQILQFLNTNKHKMTCRRNGVEKNYMKVVFDRRAYRALFSELFFNDLKPKDGSVLPDVNAVSLTGSKGTPETVLDYMDRLISTNKGGRAYTKQVKSLRKTFIKYLGAKKFTELPAAEQAKHQRIMP